MTESPFEFFSRLIDRQAALQQLQRCDCGERPVILEDRISASYWVGCRVIVDECRVIVDDYTLTGCGLGYWVKSIPEAVKQWQENADNK